MEISNNFNNPNKNIFFGDNRIQWVQKGVLTIPELKLAQKIRGNFDAVSAVYLKMGPVVQSQFKGLHSKLEEVPKLRGYIFNVKGGNRLQLSKTKTGKNSDEILTFTILDSHNEAKLHFRVSKNGDCYISDLGFGEENIPQKKLDAMKKISAAMEILKKYAENFTLVKRMVERREHGVKTAEQAVKKIIEIDDFSGYKEETTTLMTKFNKVNKLLNKNQGQMVECKQEFLEYGDKRTRGWTFKNPDNGKSYTIFPLAQKATNAVCKITETSQDGSQKVFVLCNDGKVAIPVDINPETLYIRPYNMQFLTEKEAQSNQIREMISFVDKKIDEFECFILEKRSQTPEDKAVEYQRKQNIKIQTEHRRSRRLIEKTLADEQKAKAKAEEKQAKEARNAEKAEKTAYKTKYIKMKPKTPKDKPDQFVLKTEKPEVSKSPEKPKPLEEMKTEETVNPKTPSTFSFIPVEDIVKSLNKIFDTEPSKRSPHLIHEKLPNGKVFAGRFHLNLENGSKITVTHVKSKRFDSFTYYSIKITEKDGTVHYVNIDPSRNLIINSVDGKPTVNKYGKMKFYTSFGYLGKDKWADEIPQYIAEITKQTEGEQRFINFVPTQTIPPERKVNQIFTDALRKIEIDDPFLF